jgi:hypothetical protein
VRYDELDDEADEEFYDLGARHGFEDHYLSEDIIAQLANVSNRSFMRYPSKERSRAASALVICRNCIPGSH